jgi:hypothetical protein
MAVIGFDVGTEGEAACSSATVRGLDQQTVPVACDCFVHGPQAIFDFEAASNPSKHLQKGLVPR